MNDHNTIYPWAIIGAGPAGLASAGLLLESGISPDQILLIDPAFNAGDFGTHWGEVYSNTSVELFLQFFSGIGGFSFHQRDTAFALEQKKSAEYCQLKDVTEVLLWITAHFKQTLHTAQTKVTKLSIKNGYWQLSTALGTLQAEKVILATGAKPKKLHFPHTEEITLPVGLNPKKLRESVNQNDCIAVFGSSHSSMIILKNCLDAGAQKVVNFYLSPHRYAIKRAGWTLYDNTGLKGLTAHWVKEHLSKNKDPRIERILSSPETVSQRMTQCTKAVYAIGFTRRYPPIEGIHADQYDPVTGILAPGLFGTGIAYPREMTDPLGGKEFRVGLFKFMQDLRDVLPLWQQYGI